MLLDWSLGINGPWGVWAGYSNSAQNSISAGQAEAAELSSKILALRFNLCVLPVWASPDNHGHFCNGFTSETFLSKFHLSVLIIWSKASNLMVAVSYIVAVKISQGFRVIVKILSRLKL